MRIERGIIVNGKTWPSNTPNGHLVEHLRIDGKTVKTVTFKDPKTASLKGLIPDGALPASQFVFRTINKSPDQFKAVGPLEALKNGYYSLKSIEFWELDTKRKPTGRIDSTLKFEPPLLVNPEGDIIAQTWPSVTETTRVTESL